MFYPLTGGGGGGAENDILLGEKASPKKMEGTEPIRVYTFLRQPPTNEGAEPIRFWSVFVVSFLKCPFFEP